MDDYDRLSSYFCVFCDATMDETQEALDHYKAHMSTQSYCRICDYKQSNGPSCVAPAATCTEDHEAEASLAALESEEKSIDTWIERFLSYQDELMNKPFDSIISTNKFFLGCPVCDILTAICGVVVPEEIKKCREQSAVETSSAALAQATLLGLNPTVVGIGEHTPKESIRTHTIRHACSHLKYYPYECIPCEEVGKYQKKPDMSEMMRHIKDSHVKTPNAGSGAVESLVKLARITKLEKFIENYVQARPMIRFDPAIGGRIIAKESSNGGSCSGGSMSNSRFENAIPSPSVATSASGSDHEDHFTGATSFIAAKTSSSSAQRNSHIHSASNSAAALMATPNTYDNDGASRDNITPKFTIIKSKSSAIKQVTTLSDSARFKNDFSNIFNGDEMAKLSANHEEDLVG